MKPTIKKVCIFLSIWTFCMFQSCQPNHFNQILEQYGTSYDILVKDAVIIDGTGNPGFMSDILIQNDEIVYVGKVDTAKIQFRKEIDAAGRLATPGFIDVHAHGNPMTHNFENFMAMGVTTVVLGQDGYTPDTDDKETHTLAEWMDKLAQYGPSINVAMLAGHGSLRRAANIQDTLPATENQISDLTTLLNHTLHAGCFGISTGIEYVPGMYATQNELDALAKTVGSQNGIMMSHVRNEDDDAIEHSINELKALGRFCKVHISHIKVVYGKGQERANQVLTMLKDIDPAENKVTADVYPYLASYTGIGILFPIWAKTREQFNNALKTRRNELEEYLTKRIQLRNGPGATLFGSGKYTGKTLAEVSEETGLSPIDILLEIGPGGASGAYFIMDQELQDVFITDEEIMISTDGSPTMHHPRGYGTYARILEKYVVKERKMSIEKAIKKMTSIPAETIGLSERGYLKAGYKADINIFDAYEIREHADYVSPHKLAGGFNLVIINGKISKENGSLVTERSGKLLRKKYME